MSGLWKCDVCGYVSRERLGECPKCGTEDSFDELSEEETALIESAWRTNDLYMEINSLAERMQDAAREGIEEDLDGGCSDVFEKILDSTQEVQGMLKAEIAGHVDKGKWG